MRTLFAKPTFVTGLLVTLLAGACSDKGEPTSEAPKDPNPNRIKIALVTSLTGTAEAIGEETKRGAEVAVTQLNARGGLLGKIIELEVADDGSNGDQTLAKVNELKAKGITVGIGLATSTTALKIKELIASDQVVYISPSATSKVLDSPTEEPVPDPEPGQPPAVPVFFRTAPNDTFLAAALGQYAVTGQEGGLKTCPRGVVLVQQNDTYGIPIANSLDKYYKLSSISVAKRIDLDPNVDNATKLDDAAAASGNTTAVDCQVVVAQPRVAGEYMLAFKRFKERNGALRDWAKFITIGSDGFRQNEFIITGRDDRSLKEGPTAGDGSFAIAAETAPATPEYKFFENLFRAQFPGFDPGRYGSTSYDAMILLAAAIERAGGTEDHKKIRDNLYSISGQGTTRVGPNDLRNMFDQLRRGELINYEGASGAVNFEPNGSVRASFGVWKIENAKYIQIRSFSAAELTALPD
jgi:ABC-type branched-subunit amino acid transport system substrate-binding protein